MSKLKVKNTKNFGKKSKKKFAEKFEYLGSQLKVTLPENVASALRRKLEQLKA